jgi:cell division protein FtsL
MDYTQQLFELVQNHTQDFYIFGALFVAMIIIMFIMLYYIHSLHMEIEDLRTVVSRQKDKLMELQCSQISTMKLLNSMTKLKRR